MCRRDNHLVYHLYPLAEGIKSKSESWPSHTEILLPLGIVRTQRCENIFCKEPAVTEYHPSALLPSCGCMPLHTRQNAVQAISVQTHNILCRTRKGSLFFPHAATTINWSSVSAKPVSLWPATTPFKCWKLQILNLAWFAGALQPTAHKIYTSAAAKRRAPRLVSVIQGAEMWNMIVTCTFSSWGHGIK